MQNIEKLKHLIKTSENIVFFGGAGVSTESGIPDFRSQDGLYSQKYAYPPETILSHSFFFSDTESFYEFYRDKMLYLSARPNFAHKALVKLEHDKKLKAIVTQNIDGLHQIAGSNCVYELHGSVHRNFCTKCKKFYSLNDILNMPLIPKCTCKAVIKPDVVLYEESLNPDTMESSVDSISKADLLIIGGTSLNVYPAAGLVRYFNGDNIVLINKSQTPYDSNASLVINEPIGEVLEKAVN